MRLAGISSGYSAIGADLWRKAVRSGPLAVDRDGPDSGWLLPLDSGAMKLLFTTLSLCLAVLVSGCQSWTTIALTVESADVQNIRAAIASAITVDAFAPCADWHVGVAGADLCLGGRVDGNSVTVAGFQTAKAYVVKIGFYGTGRIDSGVRERIEARCKQAISAAAPGAQVTRTESGELLELQRI